jgi:transcriptional regulator of acetoin/glycerol metabolism
MKKLSAYKWPGNIRELQHIMERAVILGESSWLKPSDFLLSQETEDPREDHGYRMEDVEKFTITRVLKKNRFNISKAAGELGMARTTLYRKMTKYGLS